MRLNKEVIMSSHDVARMTIDIPYEQHRKLKAIAALRGVTMKAIILECLSKELYSDNVPNEITERTLQESDRDKNVNYYTDLNELRERYGI